MVANARPNIWQLQSRRDIHGLIEALQYQDPEVRKRAAIALRTLDVLQAVPALKAALHRETDPQTRHSLAVALHELDHRTDVEGLIRANDMQGLVKALKSRHPENVIAAARALGRLNDRMAVEPLVILFHNAASPPAVRLAAAEALLELKSAPAVVTLLGALRRDSWQVRRNAAAVLGQIQATWAVAPLVTALDDPHPVVRRTAAAALRRIGTSDAIAALRVHFAPRVASNSPAPVQPAPTVPPQPAPQKAAPPETPPVPAAPQHAPRPLPETRSQTASPPPQPPPSLPPEEQPSPAKITQPVRKLIAFLTQRTSNKA